MNKIFQALLLLFSSFAYGEAPTKKENERQDSQVEKPSEKRNLIGGSIHTTFGERTLGLFFGRFWNEKNLSELAYSSWSDEEVENSNFLMTDAKIFDVTHKYFYKSFFVKGGLYYRDMSLKSSRSDLFTINDQLRGEFSREDIGTVLGIGNQWFGERWSFSVIWLTLTMPLVKMNEEFSEDLVSFSELSPLELSLSYLF